MRRSFARWSVGLLFSFAAIAAEPKKPSLADLATQLAQVRGQLKNAEDNLRFVETQYTQRAETTPEEGHDRRFSDGEIQYLLTDYGHAAVLFYDLVSDPTFKDKNPRYPDALNYLADSLFREGNLLGARLYLRQLLAVPSKHEREALGRYLEIAGKLNEFAGIDALIEQAQRNAGGQLPPELTYVYGKWLFKRTDLKDEDRWARTQTAFDSLNVPGGKFRWPAAYFLGVLSVQRGKMDEAIQRFSGVSNAPSEAGPTPEIRELAQLSLGRVLYELGRYDQAIDRYQDVQRESPRFPEALYETAWAYVKRGQFEQARNATDLVLLVAPDSTLAPEAQLLLAHLQLKLKRYREADQTYNGVINAYAPVRDEVDALLTVHRDPVAYFDRLLARRDKDLDVSQLLPTVALKWATTQRAVSDAVQMVTDLENGRQSMKDAKELADRILQALNTRALETFPALQEGYTRISAVSSGLTQTEQGLINVETLLLEEHLVAQEKLKLDELREKAREVEKKFSLLPRSTEELQSRRKRMRERVNTLDREAFKLTTEIQSLNAVIAALGKWLNDTRAERTNSAEDEKAFIAKVKGESAELAWLSEELNRLRGALLQERGQSDVTVGGEETIRNEYAQILDQERQLLQGARDRLSPQAMSLARDADEVRRSKEKLQARADTAKTVLVEQLKRRGELIRGKVVDEQKLLAQYGDEVNDISSDARQLVGRIAFDSFRRVRQQFYDLVLKADVGLVDVAFTRKQDKTGEIQQLSSEKDHALKSLDQEFQGVLEEAD